MRWTPSRAATPAPSTRSWPAPGRWASPREIMQRTGPTESSVSVLGGFGPKHLGGFVRRAARKDGHELHDTGRDVDESQAADRATEVIAHRDVAQMRHDLEEIV